MDIVQAALLFGTETGVVNPHTRRVLGGVPPLGGTMV